MIRIPTIVVRDDVLTSWLKVSNHTQSQLAEALNVSKGRVSQLLTSQGEPSAHLIAKLIVVTQLPFERLFKLVIRHDQRVSSLTLPVTVSRLRRQPVARAASS